MMPDATPLSEMNDERTASVALWQGRFDSRRGFESQSFRTYGDKTLRAIGNTLAVRGLKEITKRLPQLVPEVLVGIICYKMSRT